MTTSYQFHPFCEVWRLFTDAELAALKADIAANGQRLPIVLYQGRILDGRNRYRACQELGIVPRFETAAAKTDHAALMLVVSLNEHRRHSSLEERAFAADRLAAMRHGTNQHQMKVDTSAEVSSVISAQTAADLMNVGKASLERARAIVKYGGPELEQAVRNKKISLNAAAQTVTPKRKPAVREPSLRQRVIDSRTERLRRLGPPLTREQVDPGFTGSGGEFVEKHGHVQIRTAAEQERQKKLNAISDWLGAVSRMAEIARELLQLPEIDPARWSETSAGRKRRLVENLAAVEATLQRVKACGLSANSRPDHPTHRNGTTSEVATP